MNTVRLVFYILSELCIIYSFLCSIRIILTWIPGLDNGFTRFISKICDPYLNLFSGRLLIGAIDFSPILALAILALFSMLFGRFSQALSLSFGFVLSSIVFMAWSVVSSVLGFLMLILIIRLIVLLLQNNSYNGSQFWRQFDYTINPIVYRIANTFSNRKMFSYKTTLIISIVALLVVNIAGYFFFTKISELINLIPF